MKRDLQCDSIKKWKCTFRLLMKLGKKLILKFSFALNKA